ncbi:MAG: phosphate signaling complex protein PhoU [Actinomycetota bacterium]|nr:phosphate signaling complex protein PhoU [Actinomycetota bacterium]MDA2972018.1 phosphate signaling complex protein PhoU [Actinomycetota bacterium]MDA3000434.1 phosphate signaling complex protein PhoU [Actinomycetota bacterium]
MNRTAQEKLDDLREETLALGAMLVDSIPRSTNVLLDQDMEGAEYQILADDEYDARTISLEEASISLMALHAPVASELRHAVVVMKMSGELERSADLVTKLCKVARRINGHPLDDRLARLIAGMSEQAHLLMKQAMMAYADKDLAIAKSVCDMDLYLDTLHKQFIQAIFEAHSDGKVDLAVGIQMAKTARFYERVGDHAVNIARLVEFLVTGVLPPAGDHHRDGRGDLTPIGIDRPPSNS